MVAHHRRDRDLERGQDLLGELELVALAVVGDVAELDHELGPGCIDVGDRCPGSFLAGARPDVHVGQDRHPEDHLSRSLDMRDLERLVAGDRRE